MKEKGVLVILTGPGGAGKDTVINRAAELSEHTVIAVSHTTRSPRSGEVEGVHYYFVTEEEFKEKVKSGEMLEWVSFPPPVNGVILPDSKFYGVGKEGIDIALAEGKDVLLILDVQGATHVREIRPDCISVFICPPGHLNANGEIEIDYRELEKRLRKRGDTEAQIQTRLKLAPKEIESAKEYTKIIFNAEVDIAALEILSEAESHALRMRTGVEI